MNLSVSGQYKICPLCGIQTNSVLSSQLRRGQGLVFYCDSCRHGFLSPNKDFNEKKYYSDTYRQEYSHNAEISMTNAREIFETYSPYQQDRLTIVSPYLKANQSLLEVGASSGQFLAHIKNKLGIVNAIELDIGCCNFLRGELGIDADSEPLADSKFAGKKYDLVCSFQVMEHVVNPVLFLKDLIRATNKGGVIFVEVPNLYDPLLSVWDIDSYSKFFYHSAHLHYFTDYSLKNCAINAGYSPENIQIVYSQDYNLLNHINWITTGVPHKTCHIGLGEIKFNGVDLEIANWLTSEINFLDKKYREKLVAAKCTSNIMMVLSNA